jgi:hypothetical protein
MMGSGPAPAAVHRARACRAQPGSLGKDLGGTPSNRVSRRAGPPDHRVAAGATAHVPRQTRRPGAAPRGRAPAPDASRTGKGHAGRGHGNDGDHHQQLQQCEAALRGRTTRQGLPGVTASCRRRHPCPLRRPGRRRQRHHVDFALDPGVEVLVGLVPGVVGQLFQVGLPVGRRRGRGLASPAPAGPARPWGSAGCPACTA